MEALAQSMKRPIRSRREVTAIKTDARATLRTHHARSTLPHRLHATHSPRTASALWSSLVMLHHVWPTLPAPLRDELILQCVKHLRNSPDELNAFALIVADITKSRAQSVKSQWKLNNIFGTKIALARDPQKAAHFLASMFMGVRPTEVAALYAALGVGHKDLLVDEASAVTHPPTQAQFADALAKGVDGVPSDIVRCMIAVIADAGIEAWQEPARAALQTQLAPR